MITVAIADHFAPLMVFFRVSYQYARKNEAFEYRQENDFDIETRRSIRCTQVELDVFPFSPVCRFRRASR